MRSALTCTSEYLVVTPGSTTTRTRARNSTLKAYPWSLSDTNPAQRHTACGTQQTTKSSSRRMSPLTKPCYQTNQSHHWSSLQPLHNDLTSPTRCQRENRLRSLHFHSSCSTKTTTTHQSHHGTFCPIVDGLRALQALPLAHLARFLPLHLANCLTLLLTLPHLVPVYGKRSSPIRMTKPTKLNN